MPAQWHPLPRFVMVTSLSVTVAPSAMVILTFAPSVPVSVVPSTTFVSAVTVDRFMLSANAVAEPDNAIAASATAPNLSMIFFMRFPFAC